MRARRRTANAELSSARETRQQTEIYLRVARGAAAAGTGTALAVHTAQLGLDRAEIAVQQALLALALLRAEEQLVYGVAIHEAGGRR